MVMSRDQNAGRSCNIKIDNSSFETAEQFKYLGKTLTYKNSIQEEIKSTVKSGNAYYHALQNILSSSWLSKILKTKIHTAIILPIVLYGCETWSLILREKRRLRVLENRVLRRIFGSNRDDVTGEWRKLHEELNDLYSSRKIIRVIKSRRIRWAGYAARMGKRTCAYKVLVGKSEGKRALGRPRHTWTDNARLIQKVSTVSL